MMETLWEELKTLLVSSKGLLHRGRAFVRDDLGEKAHLCSVFEAPIFEAGKKRARRIGEVTWVYPSAMKCFS